jgi:hypothetical protein
LSLVDPSITLETISFTTAVTGFELWTSKLVTNCATGSPIHQKVPKGCFVMGIYLYLRVPAAIGAWFLVVTATIIEVSQLLSHHWRCS